MRTIFPWISTTILAGLVLGCFSGAALSQPPIKQQLVGTWTLVSVRATNADGTTTDPYGPQGRGILIFDDSGHFALVLANPDIPKYASNNRNIGTPAEFEAAAKGSFAFFGTYTANDAEASFVFHIDASTFSNFNGTDQKRVVKAMTADTLDFVNLAPPGGGTITELIYQRVR